MKHFVFLYIHSVLKQFRAGLYVGSAYLAKDALGTYFFNCPDTSIRQCGYAVMILFHVWGKCVLLGSHKSGGKLFFFRTLNISCCCSPHPKHETGNQSPCAGDIQVCGEEIAPAPRKLVVMTFTPICMLNFSNDLMHKMENICCWGLQ